jgi:hypothetical protein
MFQAPPSHAGSGYTTHFLQLLLSNYESLAHSQFRDNTENKMLGRVIKYLSEIPNSVTDQWLQSRPYLKGMVDTYRTEVKECDNEEDESPF